MVIIAPDWRNQDWYSELWRHARRYHYYEKGHDFFELHGNPVPETPWGVWAVLIDATGDNKKRPEPEQEKKRTDAARRRWRRRRREEGDQE